MATAACGQADCLLKLPCRSGPPLAPGNNSAPGAAPTNSDRCSASTGLIAFGMPTTRVLALDFGGPSTTCPFDRSTNKATRSAHRGPAPAPASGLEEAPADTPTLTP